MAKQALSTNNFGQCKWIVNPNKALGTHTTISAAITSASAGDDIFIMPGTYSAALTVNKSINFVGFTSDSPNATVKITGAITVSGTHTAVFSNLDINSGSSVALTVSGAAGIVYLNNCYMSSSSGAEMINFSANGGTGYFKDCVFSYSGSGNYITAAGGGNSALLLQFEQCQLLSTATNSPALALGRVIFKNCYVQGYLDIVFPTTNTYFINSVINNYAPSSVNTPAVLLNPAATSGVIYSYKSTYISAGSTAPCIGEIGGSAMTYNSYGDTFITGYTSAIERISGLATLVFNYCGLSCNISSIFGATQITVTPTITGGGFYLGNQYGNTQTNCLGQQIESYIASGSAVALTTATSKNVTSISLTAGIWDVDAIIGFTGSPTGTQTIASISSTTNTLNANTGDATVQSPDIPNGSTDLMLEIPQFRIAISATTTYYLVAEATFSAGSVSAYGRISATRSG